MKYIILVFVISSIVYSQNIEIKNAWIRPGVKGMNTALYFEIVNNGDSPDTLYKASSKLSKVIELHETYVQGEMMGMKKTKSVVISPKSTFPFKPGGNHVMLIDLKKKLSVGQTGEIQLYFKKAGIIKVKGNIKK